MTILRRILSLALALLLACMSTSALATSVIVDTYSDAPATPTQDNVNEILAAYLPQGLEKVPCSIRAMEPTALTVEILKEIFDFVDINKQPPARYFPEETQKEIQQIIHADPDILYMPEFFSAEVEDAQLEADVDVEMHMNIDYQPGQLVVPVLGRETENGIQWKALPAQSVEEDIIRFTVPADVMAQYAGGETLLALLATKPGEGLAESEEVIREEEVFIPSKSASDIIYVVDEVLRNTEGEAVDCQIIIVPRTKAIDAELEKLTAHFTDPEKRPIRYFDAETVNETALLLKKIDIDTLLPYEITQVMAVDYKEPYGDVMARMAFPTPFGENQAIVALIGMPDQEEAGVFNWTPLRVEKVDHFLEITFSSTVLPAMMKDAGILLVMGELIEE